MLKTFLRVFFSCMLTLFLAIFALAAGLCHYGYTVVSNPATLQKTAVDSGYVEQLYGEIVYDWENYLAITGVETPEEIMSVLTQEQVTDDALHYLLQAYNGSAAIDTDTQRHNLESKVRAYAYSHDIQQTPDEELEENIQDLVNACIDDYHSAISIPMLTKILSTIQRYGNILPACLIGLSVGCIVLLVFLFFLQKKKQDVLYYVTICATTGSIILLLAPRLAAHYNIVNRLPFTDSALSTLVKVYLQSIFSELNRYGMVFIIAAAISFALYVIITIIASIIHRNKSTVLTTSESTEETI